jgi:NitT/TauT family transport system substrate-binding protein
MPKNKKSCLISSGMLVLVAVLSLTVSCSRKADTIALSDQFGLAYAPVTAARLQGWFEQALPDYQFEWRTVSNAAAIRESILSGDLDGGFMGIPPYLIGLDRGMKWTAVEAVADAELGLTATDPEIRSLADISDRVRIALPQPGSIQHILLAMAAHKELGDATRFDNQLVSLAHPDGMNALLSGGDVGAHFTAPPYLQMELDTGLAHQVLDGESAFGGPYTFIIMVFSDSFILSHGDAVDEIRQVIRRGAEWIERNPQDAAVLLADHYQMETAEMEKVLLSGSLSFGGEIRGMETFRDFMHSLGYLKTDMTDVRLQLP